MTWQGGQRGSSDGIGEIIATALGFVRPWDILFINLVLLFCSCSFWRNWGRMMLRRLRGDGIFFGMLDR